jgi:hypothetical protein
LQNNKTHQIHKQVKNKFFDAIESPRHQQFSHQAELGFATFIHRKHLTLFLGYRVTTLGAKPSKSKPMECRGAYLLTSPSLRSFTSIKSVLNFFFHDTHQVFGMYHMKKLLWGTLAPMGIPFSNMPPQDIVLCKHPNTLRKISKVLISRDRIPIMFRSKHWVNYSTYRCMTVKSLNPKVFASNHGKLDFPS